MANKWGVLHFDQDVSDDPAYHIKRGDALYRIEKKMAVPVGPFLIQMFERVEREWSEAQIVASDPMSAWNLLVGKVIGRSNVIPFSRVQNPMMYPERLHYPVPPAFGLRAETPRGRVTLPSSFLRPVAR